MEKIELNGNYRDTQLSQADHTVYQRPFHLPQSSSLKSSQENASAMTKIWNTIVHWFKWIFFCCFKERENTPSEPEQHPRQEEQQTPPVQLPELASSQTEPTSSTQPSSTANAQTAPTATAQSSSAANARSGATPATNPTAATQPPPTRPAQATRQPQFDWDTIDGTRINLFNEFRNIFQGLNEHEGQVIQPLLEKYKDYFERRGLNGKQPSFLDYREIFSTLNFDEISKLHSRWKRVGTDPIYSNFSIHLMLGLNETFVSSAAPFFIPLNTRRNRSDLQVHLDTYMSCILYASGLTENVTLSAEKFFANYTKEWELINSVTGLLSLGTSRIASSFEFNLLTQLSNVTFHEKLRFYFKNPSTGEVVLPKHILDLILRAVIYTVTGRENNSASIQIEHGNARSEGAYFLPNPYLPPEPGSTRLKDYLEKTQKPFLADMEKALKGDRSVLDKWINPTHRRG